MNRGPSQNSKALTGLSLSISFELSLRGGTVADGTQRGSAHTEVRMKKTLVALLGLSLVATPSEAQTFRPDLSATAPITASSALGGFGTTLVLADRTLYVGRPGDFSFFQQAVQGFE